MKTLFTGATAALSLILGFEHDATAQRATQQPSAETAVPGNAPPPPPPPPGLMPGLCGSAIVCGRELSSQFTARTTFGNGRAAVSDDSNLDLYANYSTWLSAYSTIKLERQRNGNLDSFFPDRNAAFRSEGVTLRQLFLAARPLAAATIYGGKIHPNFGSAFEEAPGNFYISVRITSRTSASASAGNTCCRKRLASTFGFRSRASSSIPAHSHNRCSRVPARTIPIRRRGPIATRAINSAVEHA